MSDMEQRISGEEEGKGSGVWGKVAIGCGAGCLVVVILGVVAGVILMRKARSLGADFAKKAIEELVADSDLPADKKAAVNGHVGRLTDAFKGGKVSLKQLAKAGERLAEGPLVPYIMVSAFETKHVAPSSLSAEEKQQAKLDLQRFVRGFVEKKIPKEAVDQLMNTVTVEEQVATPTGPAGQTHTRTKKKLKEKLTPEELKAFLVSVKEHADKAEVPNEPYELDVAEEVRKVVDSALKAQEAPSEAP